MIDNNKTNSKSSRVVRSLLTRGAAFALLAGIGTSCSQSMDEEAMTRTGAPMTVTATMQGVGKPAATISEVVSGSDATLPSSRTTASDVATDGSYTAAWQKGDVVNVTFYCYSDAGATTEIAASQMATGNIQTLTYDGTAWTATPASLRLPVGTYSVKAVYAYSRTYSSADDSSVDATTTSMIINRGTEQIAGRSAVVVPDDITKTGIAIAPAADKWQRQTALVRLTGLPLGKSVCINAKYRDYYLYCPTVQTADPTKYVNEALTATVYYHWPINNSVTVSANAINGLVKPIFNTEAGRMYSIHVPVLFLTDYEDSGQKWNNTYANFYNNGTGDPNINYCTSWIIDLSAVSEADKPAALTFINDKAKACNKKLNITLTGIEALPSGAFLECDKLESLYLPTVTIVEENAVRYCKALTSVSIPKATTIGKFAFCDCTALTNVNLPLANDIGNSAFFRCSAITNLSLPSAITLQEYAIYGCSSLVSVDLPVAEEVKNFALGGCTSIKSITLPSATNLVGGVFASCSSLNCVDLPVASTLGLSNFTNCNVLNTLKITAAGSLNISSQIFEQFSNSANCTLYLNVDKKPGGKGWPLTDSDGISWYGRIWKAIQYVE